MLPVQIEKRFKFPKQLQKEFINYLRVSGAKISQDKTIASQVLYHSKAVGVTTSETFFNGAFSSDATNIVGQFIRPESEHFVIYGIRMYTSNVAGTASEQIWTRGLGTIVRDNLRSAYISIDVNGLRVLKNFPTAEFDEDLTTKDQGTAYIDEPILWQGQTDLKLNLQSPDATPFGLNQWVRFDLVGIGLI